ncbi:hypothetical protein HYV89_02845 [Candidatus Woesearchaeota archaeon]|nr:hypothetical protein [Candidatus Woesearchaeota archaeon]
MDDCVRVIYDTRIVTGRTYYLLDGKSKSIESTVKDEYVGFVYRFDRENLTISKRHPDSANWFDCKKLKLRNIVKIDNLVAAENDAIEKHLSS